MTETISVSVTGSALALFLYENMKVEYDQDGFLLGNIVTRETNKLTDADHRVVNTQHTLIINSAVPCPQQFYFYNSSGIVDVDKIKSFLGNQEEKVIGWFLHKRKCVSMLKAKLREKIILKGLTNYFSKQTPFFICCLSSAESSTAKSTHTFCQTFIRYNKCRYDTLPFHIVNINDPCYVFKTREPTSDSFQEIISSAERTGSVDGPIALRNIHDNILDYMKKMVLLSSETEQELFKLEQEIKQIKSNIQTDLDIDYAISDLCHNGGLENTDSEVSESLNAKAPEDSIDNSKKKRLRSRKQNNNNLLPSSVKNCDVLKENEESLSKHSRTLSKANVTYSEATQKRRV